MFDQCEQLLLLKFRKSDFSLRSFRFSAVFNFMKFMNEIGESEITATNGPVANPISIKFLVFPEISSLIG